MVDVIGVAHVFYMIFIYKYIALCVHNTQGINHIPLFTLFSHDI